MGGKPIFARYPLGGKSGEMPLNEITQVGPFENEPESMLVRHGQRYFRISRSLWSRLDAVQQHMRHSSPSAPGIEAEMAQIADDPELRSLAEIIATPGRRSSPIRFRREIDASRLVEILARRSGGAFRSDALMWTLAAIGISVNFGFLASVPLPTTASPLSAAGYLLVILALVSIAALHELAHAVSAQSLGAKTGKVGCGLMFIYPVFYADVSAIWTLRARNRIVVNGAGLVVQGMVGAAIIFINMFFFGGSSLILSKIIWINLAVIIINLLPFLKMDGYWLLSDLARVENLDAEARRAFGAEWLRLRGGAHADRRRPMLALYQLGKIAFFVLLIVNLLAGVGRVWQDRHAIELAIREGAPFPHPVTVVIISLLALRLSPIASKLALRLWRSSRFSKASGDRTGGALPVLVEREAL